MAPRTFIIQRRRLILLSPVPRSGLDEVALEANSLSDRNICQIACFREIIYPWLALNALLEEIALARYLALLVIAELALSASKH